MPREWDQYFAELKAVSEKRSYLEAFENAGKSIQDNYQYICSDKEFDYFKNPHAETLEKKNIQIRY